MNLTIEQQNELALAVQAFLKCSPSEIDEPAIRAWLRDWTVDSAASIARVFGFSSNTVKQSWRSSGMPGDAKANEWPLAEILIWLLKRNDKNCRPAAKRPGTGDRKKDAEIRKVEAEAQLKEIAVEQKEGEFISSELVGSDFSAAMAIIRDEFMALGRSIMPQFPKSQAVELRQFVDRQVERVLNAAADKLEAAVEKHKRKKGDEYVEPLS